MKQKLLLLLFSICFSMSIFAQGTGTITLTGTQGASYLNTHPKYGSITVGSSTSTTAYNAATGKRFKYDNTRSVGDKWVEESTGATYTWNTTAPSSNTFNLRLLENGTATTTVTTVTTSNGIKVTGTANAPNFSFSPADVTTSNTDIPEITNIDDVTTSTGRTWKASASNTMGVPVGTTFIKSTVTLLLQQLDVVYHRFKFML